MASYSDLKGKTKEASKKIESILESDDPTLIDRTEQAVAEVKSLARELVEEQYSNSYEELTNKLEKGKDLSESEIKQVLELMAGVASYYNRIEDSFKYWKAELEELKLQLEKATKKSTFRNEDLMKLQAFCEEAKKFLPDIRNFLNYEERVDRLESTLRGGYTVEEGRIIADAIRDKMLSEDR